MEHKITTEKYRVEWSIKGQLEYSKIEYIRVELSINVEQSRIEYKRVE